MTAASVRVLARLALAKGHLPVRPFSSVYEQPALAVSALHRKSRFASLPLRDKPGQSLFLARPALTHHLSGPCMPPSLASGPGVRALGRKATLPLHLAA
jgi:hypothetical protein